MNCKTWYDPSDNRNDYRLTVSNCHRVSFWTSQSYTEAGSRFRPAEKKPEIRVLATPTTLSSNVAQIQAEGAQKWSNVDIINWTNRFVS